MSELKARGVDDVYIEYYNTGKHELAQVYLKSEADKVIAELEESHKMEIEQLLIEIAELKAQKAQTEDDCAYWKTMAQKNAADNAVMAKQRAEALKRESRQKYKRCLSNAWWCLREEFYAEDCHCERWVDWTIKWYKRWLELAEEPTWAKFLQLIHKEEK